MHHTKLAQLHCQKRKKHSKHFFYSKVVDLGLELVALLKLHLTMLVFLCILRAAEFLSNSKHLLPKDYTEVFIYD